MSKNGLDIFMKLDSIKKDQAASTQFLAGKFQGSNHELSDKIDAVNEQLSTKIDLESSQLEFVLDIMKTHDVDKKRKVSKSSGHKREHREPSYQKRQTDQIKHSSSHRDPRRSVILIVNLFINISQFISTVLILK